METAALAGLDKADAAKTQMRDRPRAFLKRKRTDKDNKEYRPRKRHRLPSYHLLACFQNMLAHWIVGGLLHFAVTADMLSQPAATWPRLAVPSDMGSDNVCSFSFLQRKVKLCLDLPWDPSHGAHDDVFNGVRYALLMGHLMLSLVRLNCVCGPWNEDRNYKNVLNAMGGDV